MKWSVAVIAFLLVAPLVSADVFIANTASWQNVYSAGIFAALQGNDFKFLVNQRHSKLILDEINPGTKITIIESDTVPFARNYANQLRNAGYTANDMIIPEDDGNFDLAKRLDTRKFIVVDPTFGYDAISVAPYAVATEHYVLFASKENIDRVKAFLDFAPVERLMLYGDIDDEVKEALAVYSPEIVYKGNRFENNIEIADRFQKLTNARQAILTNGEFLEQDIFSAGRTNQAVLFIGRDNPPQVVMDYLKVAGYQTTVVVGNELIGSAQVIKETLGISLFIKFAKGVTGKGGFKDVQGLDMFPVPHVDLLISLTGVYYNLETGQIELILRNERKARTYVLNSLVIQADGVPIQTLGSDVIEPLDDEEARGFTFDANLAEQVDKNLTAEVFIPYGPQGMLENALTGTVPVQIISEKDKCDVEIENVEYNKKTQRFEVTLSSQSCYARTTIRNLIVDDEPTNIQSGVEKIGRKKTITIKQRLNEVDIADNPKIVVEVRHGARAEVLSQVKEKEFPLEFTKENMIDVALDKLPIIGVIAIFILFMVLWKRKKRRKQ